MELRGYLFGNVRSDLISERADLYAAAIKQKGAPWDNCVGFSDCTKIQNSWPGRSAINQHAIRRIKGFIA